MTGVYIFLALLLMGFIITAHEFGHYAAGRIVGIAIDEFSIGFGPKIKQWEKSGIKYTIRCIPMGGYVKYIGEDEENSDPRAYNNQSVWKRFVSVISGAMMNFILAYLITVIVAMCFGVQQTVPVIAGFTEGFPAKTSGLMTGDVITAVNGEPISYDIDGFYKMGALLNMHDAAQPVKIDIRRGDGELSYTVDLGVTESGAKQIGVMIGADFIQLSLAEALPWSIEFDISLVKSMLIGLRDLIFKGEGINDTMGPVGIIGFVSENIKRGVDVMLELVLIISLNLGIMNMLPFPALDGGRLVLLLVEAIRRKPIDRDKEGLTHLIGFGILMVFVVIITYKDIVRLVTG